MMRKGAPTIPIIIMIMRHVRNWVGYAGGEGKREREREPEEERESEEERERDGKTREREGKRGAKRA